MKEPAAIYRLQPTQRSSKQGESVIKGALVLIRNKKTLGPYQGQRIASALRSHLETEIEIPSSPITVGSANIATLAKNNAGRVGIGVALRDAAMKVGAQGATTLVVRDKELVLSGMNQEYIDKNRLINELLIENLQPAENNVIIIGSAHISIMPELGRRWQQLPY